MSDERTIETDVLIVGAGPGGSAAAYQLARHGIDVTVVERATFPREKVCGDGLTPRAVRSLVAMGIDTEDPGFERVLGLRVHARGTTIDLPWPELSTYPGYGLVMPRDGFDHLLAQRAVKAGARMLEATEVVGPVRDGVWVRGSHGAADRGARRHDDTDRRALRDRRRRRIQPLRRRRGGAPRRHAAARDRRAALLPRRPTTRDRGSSRGSTCGTGTCSCRATAGCSRWPAAGSTWARVC